MIKARFFCFMPLYKRISIENRELSLRVVLFFEVFGENDLTGCGRINDLAIGITYIGHQQTGAYCQ